MKWQRVILGTIVVCLVLVAVASVAQLFFDLAILVWEPLLRMTWLMLAVFACCATLHAGRLRWMMTIGLICGVFAFLITLILGGIDAWLWGLHGWSGYAYGGGGRPHPVDALIVAGNFALIATIPVCVVAAHWAILFIVDLRSNWLKQLRTILMIGSLIVIALIMLTMLQLLPQYVMTLIASVMLIALMGGFFVTGYLVMCRRVRKYRLLVHGGAIAVVSLSALAVYFTDLLDAVASRVYLILDPTLGNQIDYFMFTSSTVMVVLALTGVVLTIHWSQWLLGREHAREYNQSLTATITCPMCAHEQTVRTGVDHCAGCNLILRLTFEQPICECGYLLQHISSGKCPECGKPIDGSAKPQPSGSAAVVQQKSETTAP